MNSKEILRQIIAIFTLFCTCKFDSIAGQSRDGSRGSKIGSRPNNSSRCSADEFECSNGACIDKKLLCNGFSDCRDGNDEQIDTCQNNKCSAEKFRCASGACIDKKYLCDGIKHCVFDANDERRAACKNTACLANKFRCLTGSCLDRSLLCNGFSDCLDGDDENSDTCESFQCPKDKFRCSSGACIDKKFLCDGVRHCIFGTFDDESPEICKNKTKNQLPNTSCFLPSKSTYKTFTVHCPNTAECSHQAGDKVPAFTQILVDCGEGYQFSGANTSISSCFQGTWRPPLPKCYRTCAPIGSPDLDLNCLQKLKGLSIPCDEVMPEGAIVYPKCKEFYHQDREVDYSYIRCQSNGQWDRQLFKCLADCGKAQGITQSLIVGGKPEVRGDSPWHVAIYDVASNKQPLLICGGTIITPRIIVSAAHCFYDFVRRNISSPSMFEAVVAKYTLDYKVKDNSDTKVYQIQKILTPEIITFTGESTNYVGDIALLRTSEKIIFNSGVLPACVDWTYTTRFIIPDGIEGKLVGWGLNEKEKPSPVLLGALLPYVNYRNCRQMVSEDFSIGADKFCAGSKKGAGARQGDSGGGLLFRKPNTHGNLYYLRGIVSNKDGVTGEKQTSIAAFTDVAQYASWMYEKRIDIENEELLAETNVGLKT